MIDQDPSSPFASDLERWLIGRIDGSEGKGGSSYSASHWTLRGRLGSFPLGRERKLTTGLKSNQRVACSPAFTSICAPFTQPQLNPLRPSHKITSGKRFDRFESSCLRPASDPATERTTTTRISFSSSSLFTLPPAPGPSSGTILNTLLMHSPPLIQQGLSPFCLGLIYRKRVPERTDSLLSCS